MNKKVIIAVVVVVILILASALFLPIILDATKENVQEEQNQEEVKQDQEQSEEDMNDFVNDAIDEAWQGVARDSGYAYIRAIENELLMRMLEESDRSWNGTITGTDGNHVTYVGDDGMTITFSDITRADITNVSLKVEDCIITSGTIISRGYLLSFDRQELTVVK